MYYLYYFNVLYVKIEHLILGVARIFRSAL